jgi:hypothetical protein
MPIYLLHPLSLCYIVFYIVCYIVCYTRAWFCAWLAWQRDLLAVGRWNFILKMLQEALQMAAEEARSYAWRLKKDESLLCR